MIREGDVKGIAPRPLYKKFGFEEDELIIEFEYPVQKFILHRKWGKYLHLLVYILHILYTNPKGSNAFF